MSYDFNWSHVFRLTRPESVSFGLVRIFYFGFLSAVSEGVGLTWLGFGVWRYVSG